MAEELLGLAQVRAGVQELGGEDPSTWYRISGDLRQDDVKPPLIVLHSVGQPR